MHYSALSQTPDARFPDQLTDVRGFEVRTRSGDDKIGKVDDVIYSADGQIRYLDVSVGSFLNPKHVLLPIGGAQVDARNDVVWLSNLTKDQIKSFPDYSGDPGTITEDYETRVRGLYHGRPSDAELYDQGRFYADRGGKAAREARLVLSEEQLDITKRQVQAGEVGIRKTVETEHVRQTVPVTREEVTIERHPVSAEAARDVDIGEDEIRVPLMAEEVVAQKRVVPKEEVLLRKNDVTEERVVEDDVRRERLDVDDRGLADRGLVRGDVRSAGRVDADRDLIPDDVERGTERGARGVKRAGKKIANAADDVKDSIDGNPASRPGPDPTDRGSRF